MEEYVSKAVIQSISATSRASVKIGDSYFTVEFSEERSLPDVENIDIIEERRILWDTVNNEVDMQIEDIRKSFTSKR